MNKKIIMLTSCLDFVKEKIYHLYKYLSVDQLNFEFKLIDINFFFKLGEDHYT